MKHLFLTLVVIFSSHSSILYAQNGQNIISDRFNGTAAGTAKLSPNTVMYGFDNSPATVVGNGYLDTFWHTGYIIFYPEDNKAISDENPLTTVSSLNIRWDIHRNEVDVLIKNKVLAISGNTIYEFSYFDISGKKRVFQNTAAITKEFDRTKGFYELLSSGNILLLKKHETQIKPPTFNPALNIGEKDYIFEKNESFYYSKNRMIEKLKTKKAKIIEDLMINQKNEVENFIKTNHIDLKKENDLIKLFDFYNNQKN